MALVAWARGGQAQTGPTARPKRSAAVSVTDFGAVADGATDDYAAISNAINSAGSNGTVVFPGIGTYILGTGIRIAQNNLRIVVEEGATIKAKNGSNITMFQWAPGVSGGGCSGGGIIDGNRSSRAVCIALLTNKNCSNIRFSGVTVKSCHFSGIKLIQSSFVDVDGIYSYDHASGENSAYGVVAYGCTNTTIRGMRIARCDAYGIGIVADSDKGDYNVPAQRYTLDGNAIFQCAGGGINIDNGVQHVAISGGTIAGCGNRNKSFAAGILWQGGNGTQYGTITGVQISNSDGYGILLAGGGVAISGVHVVGSTYDGIFLNGITDCAVTGCRIADNSAGANPGALGRRANGITLSNSSRCSVTGNFIGDRRKTPSQGHAVQETGNSDANVIAANAVFGNVSGDFAYAGGSTANIQRLVNVSHGTLQMNAGSSSKVVADPRVRPASNILITGGTAAGAVVLGSGKSPYVSAQSAGSFTVSTADGSRVQSDAIFTYLVVN